MSWLTPIGFLGLIGLVVLIIIYIIKPNYQNKIISSTYIWKLSLKLKKKQIPISKLRNILLFICQVLAITTLALILAQPIIAAEKEETVTEKIVIIDASASMLTEYNDETRFERAVNAVNLLANEIFADEDEGGKMSLIIAGEKASLLASGVSAANKQLIFDALGDLVDPGSESPITFGKGDVTGAIKLAEEKTSVDPEAEILLYTDTHYVDAGKITVKDVKDPAEWNAAILDVRAIVDENWYRFEVDVACYGGVDADIEIYLNLYGVNSEDTTREYGATARCIGGETTTVVFARVPKGEVGADNTLSQEELGIDTDIEVFAYSNAVISIDEKDCFEYDNRFELYGGAKPPLRIQYASSSPNNFFATALLVLRDTLSKRWDVEFVELKVNEEPADEGFDFYIFEHTIPKTLPSDGVVILANPDSIPSVAGLRVEGTYNVGGSGQAYLSAGDSEHPIMSGINAESISVSKFNKITPIGDGEYTTLIQIDNGSQAPIPMVMAKNTPDQKIAVMSFSLNYSNFSMLLEFPLFMYNLFEYYSPSTLTNYVYNVDDKIELNSRSEILTITESDGNEYQLDKFPETITVKKPGTYSVSQVPISGDEVTEYFFVKMPEAESNISEVLDELYNPYFAVKEEKADFDLLLYFALALVALLFAEWWLQSREQF